MKAKMTPIEFWDLAAKLKKEEDIQTASIDSWKDLTHPYNEHGGYAQYLEFVLPYRNLIAEENGLHLHTVIHPKLPEVRSKVPPPTTFDLKGGSEWYNSGKCMITVHREDKATNKVSIIFGKIKPRSVGTMGSIDLFFDLNKLVYYDNGEQRNGYMERVYAAPKGEVKVETEEVVKVQMNGFKHSDFDKEIDFNQAADDLYQEPDSQPF
jgi:hypothetical protein